MADLGEGPGGPGTPLFLFLNQSEARRDPVYAGQDKFLNGRLFTCVSSLQGTVKILLQIALMFRDEPLFFLTGVGVN